MTFLPTKGERPFTLFFLPIYPSFAPLLFMVATRGVIAPLGSFVGPVVRSEGGRGVAGVGERFPAAAATVRFAATNL